MVHRICFLLYFPSSCLSEIKVNVVNVNASKEEQELQALEEVKLQKTVGSS